MKEKANLPPISTFTADGVGLARPLRLWIPHLEGSVGVAEALYIGRVSDDLAKGKRILEFHISVQSEARQWMGRLPVPNRAGLGRWVARARLFPSSRSDVRLPGIR
jgi:hypothetical protein